MPTQGFNDTNGNLSSRRALRLELLAVARSVAKKQLLDTTTLERIIALVSPESYDQFGYQKSL